MNAIEAGHNDYNAQAEAEARGQNPRKVWETKDGIVHMFPINWRELDRMRELWPDANGPDSPVSIGALIGTKCCNAGTVGWIDVRDEPSPFGGYVQRRTGRECCFFCGKLIGEY